MKKDDLFAALLVVWSAGLIVATLFLLPRQETATRPAPIDRPAEIETEPARVPETHPFGCPLNPAPHETPCVQIQRKNFANGMRPNS